MVYVDRPVIGALRAATAPVLILQGARGVGKTTAVRHQVEGYSYATLADRATRAFAEADLPGWLRTLALPAVIDEAQLIDDLPLALKEYVDTLGAGNSFILTGSAGIGRKGLGGADPLTRRSRRLTMQPLTPWEFARQPGSLVDLLFDAEPSPGFAASTDRTQLGHDFLVGGFPLAAFPVVPETRSQRLTSIRDAVDQTIADGVLPGAKADSLVARAVLDGLLRNPGGLLNATSLGERMGGLDPRTVMKYVSLFERLFMVHLLPNRATTATRQSPARNKVHPVDTSYSVEALARAGVDVATNRETFGAVFESHVINQLIAASAWANLATHAYYWRDAKTQREVDLVLEDGSGRRVAVEVKAATEVGPGDVAGIRALGARLGIHRGYVIYTGDQMRQLEDGVWAVPAGALSSNRAFGSVAEPAREQELVEHSAARLGPTMFAIPAAPDTQGDADIADATVFLSYDVADDEYARGGIVQFARDVAAAYAFLFGHELRTVVDRRGAQWAENWQRLGSGEDARAFLLAIITPRLLKNEQCREDILRFTASTSARSGVAPLLALPWVTVDNTDILENNDPVLVALSNAQVDLHGEIRSFASGTPQYVAACEELARRLHQSIGAWQGNGDRVDVGDSGSYSQYVEAWEHLEITAPQLISTAERAQAAIREIGSALDSQPALPAQSGALTAVLAGLSRDLQGSVGQLASASEQLGAVWRAYDADIARLRSVASTMSADQREAIAAALGDVLHMLDVPSADQVEQRLASLVNISPQLRPVARTLERALRQIRGIQVSAHAWQGTFRSTTARPVSERRRP